MKRLLTLSLLLNLVLAGMVWWRGRHEAPIPRQPRGAVGEPAARGETTRGVARVTRFAPAVAAPDTPWGRIESRDPAKLIANLRALGCPEQTIRDIVAFRVARRYREQVLATEVAAARARDYSHFENPGAYWDRHYSRLELREQMIAEIEDLFGRNDSWLQVVIGPTYRDDREYLPVDKRRQVRELDLRYRRLSQELESRGIAGTLDAEATARLAELQRQKQAELAQILSPAEQEDYLYRESPAAQYVRQHLPQAKSEAEFRVIVKVAAETGMDPSSDSGLNARYGIEPADPAVAKAAADKEAEFQRRLQEALGADRVAEQEAQKQAEAKRARLQEQQRHEQQERARLATIAESVGVSADAANQFLDRIKERQPELQTKFTELERTLTGTPEEKQKQMEATIKAEMEKQAVEIMGEKGRDFVQKAMDHGH